MDRESESVPSKHVIGTNVAPFENPAAESKPNSQTCTAKIENVLIPANMFLTEAVHSRLIFTAMDVTWKKFTKICRSVTSLCEKEYKADNLDGFGDMLSCNDVVGRVLLLP